MSSSSRCSRRTGTRSTRVPAVRRSPGEAGARPRGRQGGARPHAPRHRDDRRPPRPRGHRRRILRGAGRGARGRTRPLPGRSCSRRSGRELLREAGHPVEAAGDQRRARGVPPVELLYNTEDDSHRSIAVAIQALWRRELGVEVHLRGEELKVMLDDVREGRFQIARGMWIGDFNHPHTFLETFRSSSPQNPTGWSDEAFDKALEQAAGAVDPGESARLYLDAERIAVRGTARIPIFFPGGTTLVKPWVKGYHGSSQAIDLVRWIWMDPAFREHPDNTPASEPLELPPPGRLTLP
ncbi:MAG: ABC transporter substrate-binding protein [Polyangiaceae bacterium]